jgi:hypothetical protein
MRFRRKRGDEACPWPILGSSSPVPGPPLRQGRGTLRPGAGRVGTTIGRGAGEGFPWRFAWSIRRGKPGSLRAMVGNNGGSGPLPMGGGKGYTVTGKGRS